MNIAPKALALGCLWLAACATLCACGRVGTLDQPAPLYGAKAKAAYQAKKTAAAARAAASKDDGEAEPLAPDTPGPDQPSRGVPTLRDQPIPGAHAEPNTAPPPGGLPDPYMRPQ